MRCTIVALAIAAGVLLGCTGGPAESGDTSSTFRYSALTGEDLRGVDLAGRDLTGAVLDGANLSGLDLTGATLDLASLSGADLTGARLVGV